jgi:hypothetical protein
VRGEIVLVTTINEKSCIIVAARRAKLSGDAGLAVRNAAYHDSKTICGEISCPPSLDMELTQWLWFPG